MRFWIMSMWMSDEFRHETNSIEVATLMQRCGFYVVDSWRSTTREMLVLRQESV